GGCPGLYAGCTLTFFLYPLMVSLRRTFTPARKWLILAATPLAIDFGVNFLGIWTNTHSSRFLTGFLLGSVAVFYVAPGIMDLALRGWRNSSPQLSQSPIPVKLPEPSTLTAPTDYTVPDRRI